MNDLIIRILAQGAGQATSEIQNVAKAGHDLGKSMDNASTASSKLSGALGRVNGGALGEAAQSADRFGLSLKHASEEAGRVGEGLGHLRNMALGVAAAGGVGLVLAESFIGAGLEADRLGAKLSTLMKGAGLGDGIKRVKELGNEIAALTGGDDDAIATAIGQAIATGRTRGLAEYGIVFDETANAAIKAAGGIQTATGKQELFNQVMRLGGEAVATLRANTNEAGAAMGELNVRMGNLQEGIGLGAAQAKAAILGGVLGPILDVMEASPGLQTAAGYFGYIGSTALGAGGSILALTAQLAQTSLGFQAFRVARIANAVATTADTIATDANTIAVIANGNAVTVAAGKVGLLGRARGLVGGIGGIGGAAVGGAARVAAAGVAAIGGAALIGPAAVGTAIYGSAKTLEGLRAVKTETDDELEAKHGQWGGVWAKGGRVLGGMVDPEGTAAGNDAERRALTISNAMRRGSPGAAPRSSRDTAAELAAAQAATLGAANFQMPARAPGARGGGLLNVLADAPRPLTLRVPAPHKSTGPDGTIILKFDDIRIAPGDRGFAAFG